MIDGIPVARHAFARTVRLVTTARLRDAVLRCLADTGEERAALAEIEGATSTRLVAEDRGIAHLNSNEFVHGITHAKFINAAFAYAKPLELNRFNGPGRGAWYAALETGTCLAEVTFHMTNVLRQAGDFHATVQYAEMFASLAGEYLDLRGHTHACLHPDPVISYPVGNALATTARARGINGVIYPSVRHAGGTCFAVLWPHAIQSVAQGNVIEARWTGNPAPEIVSIKA